jgi:hypothetical protein
MRSVPEKNAFGPLYLGRNETQRVELPVFDRHVGRPDLHQMVERGGILVR